MKFQGSGFAVDVPEQAVDASAYVVSFPELGSLPPNVCIRSENAPQLQLEARRLEVWETLGATLPEVSLSGDEAVKTRGTWEYFTLVADFGEREFRMRRKEIYLLVQEPRQRLFILTGTDLLANFDQFEPFYDAIVRSFQPNAIQQLA